MFFCGLHLGTLPEDVYSSAPDGSTIQDDSNNFGCIVSWCFQTQNYPHNQGSSKFKLVFFVISQVSHAINHTLCGKKGGGHGLWSYRLNIEALVSITRSLKHPFINGSNWMMNQIFWNGKWLLFFHHFHWKVTGCFLLYQVDITNK